MFNIAIIVLAVLFLAGVNVGKALAIVSISWAVFNLVVFIVKKSMEG